MAQDNVLLAEINTYAASAAVLLSNLVEAQVDMQVKTALRHARVATPSSNKARAGRTGKEEPEGRRKEGKGGGRGRRSGGSRGGKDTEVEGRGSTAVVAEAMSSVEHWMRNWVEVVALAAVPLEAVPTFVAKLASCAPFVDSNS
jgi:hypothetical protein